MPTEFVVFMILFLVMTLVLKKMSGPTEVKGLMYSCMMKLHVCITHFRKLYIFDFKKLESRAQFTVHNQLPTLNPPSNKGE